MEEINEMMNMPAGFRFNPTQEELLNSYLKPKNWGQALPCNIVEEKELYSYHPWRVLDVHDQKNKWQVYKTDSEKVTKKSIYVFTKLKKKSATDAGGRKKKAAGGSGRENFVRTAGCGTWDAQTGPREIKDGNGKLIGFERMFAYKIPSSSTSTSGAAETNNPGRWISHEYSLPGSDWEYVLCKITLISSNKRKSTEDLEEIIVRKSSSRRVEFGTGNDDDQIQQPLAAIDYGNGVQYQANDIWSNQIRAIDCGNGQANDIWSYQSPAIDYGQYDTGIWSNDDDQNQQWDNLLNMEEIKKYFPS